MYSICDVDDRHHYTELWKRFNHRTILQTDVKSNSTEDGVNLCGPEVSRFSGPPL